MRLENISRERTIMDKLKIFNSILENTGKVTNSEFLICMGCSIVLGLIIALVHMFRNEHSKSLVITLVVLPAITQAIIMLVNGSIGAGIAVMGAFSLVRFRSGQGNAREITSIFLAVAVGLATAMGFIGIAAMITFVISLVIIVLTAAGFGTQSGIDRNLKIIIPEDLDFEGVFDDIFEKYTTKALLIRCKTTNMGSLFELTYQIAFRKGISEKAFIDELRCRNGNLTIICSRPLVGREDL